VGGEEFPHEKRGGTSYVSKKKHRLAENVTRNPEGSKKKKAFHGGQLSKRGKKNGRLRKRPESKKKKCSRDSGTGDRKRFYFRGERKGWEERSIEGEEQRGA